MHSTMLELVDTNLCWSSSVEQDIVRILSHFTLVSTLSQPGSSTTSSQLSVSTLVVSVWCQHLYWYLMSHGHHCPVLLKYLEPRQLTMSTLLSHDASAHSDLIQPLVPGLVLVTINHCRYHQIRSETQQIYAQFSIWLLARSLTWPIN